MNGIELKIAEFRDRQKTIVTMHEALEREKERYRKDMKEVFGLMDGTQANVLEIIEAVVKVVDLMK